MRTVAEHKAFLESLAAKIPNPQAGFFGPDSVAWRLNGEAVLGLVVLRALFLQVAHPKVAQGVADHSDFRHRPFERALATFKAQQRIVFGTCEESIEALIRIYVRHVAVRGAGYEANDPSLLFWVYATLIDSMFLAYRLFLPDLPEEEWSRFYEEGKLFARLIGIEDGLVPARREDFDAWMQAKLASDDITVSPAGFEVGRSLLRMPIAAAKPLTAFIAAGTLPPKLREQFGLGWSAGQQRAFDALAGAVRIGVRFTPAFLHTSPAYWLALRRVRNAAPL
jgi:uncharacterized protein (DUF2236 family)